MEMAIFRYTTADWRHSCQTKIQWRQFKGSAVIRCFSCLVLIFLQKIIYKNTSNNLESTMIYIVVSVDLLFSFCKFIRIFFIYLAWPGNRKAEKKQMDLRLFFVIQATVTYWKFTRCTEQSKFPSMICLRKVFSLFMLTVSFLLPLSYCKPRQVYVCI